MWLLACTYLVAINAMTYAAFADDKRRAVAHERRTPERVLLRLAALGGTPGAMAAQQFLRHKTRKQPFATWLLVIWCVQAGGLLLIAGLALRAPT